MKIVSLVYQYVQLRNLDDWLTNAWKVRLQHLKKNYTCRKMR